MCVCVRERERERECGCACVYARVGVRGGGRGVMCVAMGTKTCLRNVQSLAVVFRIKHWCGRSGVA